MNDKIKKAKAWRKFVNDRDLQVLPMNYAIEPNGGLFWIVKIHSDNTGWWTELASSECFKIRYNAMVYAFEKFNLPNP